MSHPRSSYLLVASAFALLAGHVGATVLHDTNGLGSRSFMRGSTQDQPISFIQTQHLEPDNHLTYLDSLEIDGVGLDSGSKHKDPFGDDTRERKRLLIAKRRIDEAEEMAKQKESRADQALIEAEKELADATLKFKKAKGNVSKVQHTIQMAGEEEKAARMATGLAHKELMFAQRKKPLIQHQMKVAEQEASIAAANKASLERAKLSKKVEATQKLMELQAKEELAEKELEGAVGSEVATNSVLSNPVYSPGGLVPTSPTAPTTAPVPGAAAAPFVGTVPSVAVRSVVST